MFYIDSSEYAFRPIRRCLFIDYIISSFIDSSGYASGPIRICLFLDYIKRPLTHNTYICKQPLLGILGSTGYEGMYILALMLLSLDTLE